MTPILIAGNIVMCSNLRSGSLHAQILLQNTLLALITPALNGVIFCDMALKGPALYVCL